MISALLPLVFLLFIGFVCGYGVRELMPGVGGQQRVKYSTKNILSSGRRDGAFIGSRVKDL